MPQHLRGGHARLEQVRDGVHGREVALELRHDVVVAAGHQLDDEASGASHAHVAVHEHAHPKRGWDLVARGKIVGEVVANLARDELDLARVRIHPRNVVHDGERTCPDGLSHVQVTAAVERQPHPRVLHEALRVATVVGRHGDSAKLAVAHDRDGDELVVVLGHGAHHLRAHEQPPQGRRRHRRRVVPGARLLHRRARRDCKRTHHAVGRRAAHDVVLPALALRPEVYHALRQSGTLAIQLVIRHAASLAPRAGCGRGHLSQLVTTCLYPKLH